MRSLVAVGALLLGGGQCCMAAGGVNPTTTIRQSEVGPDGSIMESINLVVSALSCLEVAAARQPPSVC